MANQPEAARIALRKGASQTAGRSQATRARAHAVVTRLRETTQAVRRLRQVTVVDRPLARVIEGLSSGADTWFPMVAYTANRTGLYWLSQIGVKIWGRQRIRRIDASLLGPVDAEGDWTVFEFTWRDGEIKNPFLDGQIEVAAVNAKQTHMAVSATYAPNLVLRDGAADRGTLQRIAELTLRDFAERIARQLEAG